jgi:hypothetical protein
MPHTPTTSKYPKNSNFAQPIKPPTRPLTFRDAVFGRLDNPLVSLFTLGIRLLQLIFALAAGISHAIEMSNNNLASAFIYSQVVFGLTLITLVIEAATLRSYRFVFIVESTLCVLWLAVFGVFYQIYFGDVESTDPVYSAVNISRMKTAVWLDLVNFLLWLASAVFSTAMCCSGMKASVKGALEKRRNRKQERNSRSVQAMEGGVVRERTQAAGEDRLPLYEEVPAITSSL